MKITRSINETLRKAVRNFNSKLSRLQNKGLILPEKASMKIIKSRISNKWDLNREIDRLQRFSERGIEKTVTTKGGLEISKYELNNLKREQNRLGAKLDRKIKRLGNIVPTTFGIREDVTVSQMGTEQLSNLKARRENIRKRKLSLLTKEGLGELKNLIQKTINREKYLISEFKESYTEKILLQLGYYVGYDSEKLNILKEKISKLPDRKFLELFNTEEGIRAIREYYPETKRTQSENEEDIRELYDNLFKNIDKILSEY